MKLLIVESPAKAKTISKYLDGKYTVKASVGHIRDLPKSNKSAIDIEAGFVPRYEISKGKEKIVSELKSLVKKADEVLLATDPDREGEAIAWHIKEAAGIKNPKRVVFYEITKDAVKEAIEHPRDIDENLRRAQEARRVLDRLVGYDLSGTYLEESPLWTFSRQSSIPRPSHNYGKRARNPRFHTGKILDDYRRCFGERRRGREIYACVLGRTAQRKRGGKNS